MAKKYIIFDLDGTLINSIPDMCREISLFLNAHGRRSLTEKETISIIGHGAPVLLKGAFALTGAPIKENEMPSLLSAWLTQYGKAEMAETKPYPFVVETLIKLKEKGCRLAICTNKPHVPTEAILTKLDLKKHFDVILDADALPERKPRPEPLWEAVKRMNGSNDSAVMVGDSETDAETARAAGMPVILLSYGYTHVPYEEINPDALTDSFANLPDIIEKL